MHGLAAQTQTNVSEIRVITAVSVLAYRTAIPACVPLATLDVTANTVICHSSYFTIVYKNTASNLFTVL